MHITPPLKDGIKTTEFWLTVLTTSTTASLAILELVNAGWAIATSAVLAGLYNVLRVVQKRDQLGANPPAK